MKNIFFLFLWLIVSSNTFAYDHSYNVTGEDENGNQMNGTIYSNNGEREVSGEITDDDGNEHEFNGQWDSYGQISGETEDGISVELSTN